MSYQSLLAAWRNTQPCSIEAIRLGDAIANHPDRPLPLPQPELSAAVREELLAELRRLSGPK